MPQAKAVCAMVQRYIVDDLTGNHALHTHQNWSRLLDPTDRTVTFSIRMAMEVIDGRLSTTVRQGQPIESGSRGKPQTICQFTFGRELRDGPTVGLG